jgi:lysine 6-dehydrogenase
VDFRYVVLGAGRQGVAVAYALARHGEAERVTLLDLDRASAEAGTQRIASLIPDLECELKAGECDVSKPVEVTAALANTDVAISTAPFVFNIGLTDAAIASGTCFCDLGGNTTTTRAQLLRDRSAERSGTSIVPDCGLAPGLSNILAADGVQKLDQPEQVRIWCGGLPQHPVGPLGYKLVFNFDGLVNEYSGAAEYLRGGEKVTVPTLTEIEPIEFDAIGRCEAAVTSGGTSTCPDTFGGKLHTYEYKTVRYPGHFSIMRALFELGFMDDTASKSPLPIAPKVLTQKLFEDRLSYPDIKDLVVLRVDVSGLHQKKPVTRRYELYARHDEATGFTAMEQTTAFPTALVAWMQARGSISAGAKPLESAVPTDEFLSALGDFGITIQISQTDAR